MINLLIIFAGGGLGAITRYIASNLTNSLFCATHFGTFIVNAAGCFIIGYIMGLPFENKSVSRTKLFIETGFLGGFTTFSTFSKDSVEILLQGRFLKAFQYISGSFLICILLTFLGFYIGKLQAKM